VSFLQGFRRPDTLGPILEQPAWLAILAVPLLLTLVRWRGRRRGRRALDAVGPTPTLFALWVRPPRDRWLAFVLAAIGWLSLAMGLSGPRWGSGEPDGVLVGRDVVVVLDFSRSMLAEDAGRGSRLRTVIEAAAELVAARRGRGDRFALVAFAARPTLLTPLTGDTNHLLTRLAELDPARPPAEVSANAAASSGTRIGAALALAVSAHDPRFRGAQEVVLFSDGDDPAGDREWLTGIDAARQARVRVEAVGLGDPTRDSPIFVGRELLEAPNAAGIADAVQTRLNEGVLREIATNTGGEYLPARTVVPDMAGFARPLFAGRSRILDDDATPQRRDHSPPFFAAAAVALLAAWLVVR
jgi:Ca-activated chloride channel family protein